MVFTDIDGTLTNTITGRYEVSKGLIKRLQRHKIAVVFCSAKTLAEQEKIRQDMGMREPFIIENGGAIIIPEEYFSPTSLLLAKNYKKLGNYIIIELGNPAEVIRRKLNIIRTKFKIEFKGVADISLKELSIITGLGPSDARRMADRKYGETILLINKNSVPTLMREARRIGLKVIHGGRFFDVTAGNDKGTAVKILVRLFNKEYGQQVTSFGIGDSLNDIPMLHNIDIPMLVQKPDETWSPVKIKKIVNLQGVGPKGWKNALDIILKAS